MGVETRVTHPLAEALWAAFDPVGYTLWVAYKSPGTASHFDLDPVECVADTAADAMVHFELLVNNRSSDEEEIIDLYFDEFDKAEKVASERLRDPHSGGIEA